MNNYVRDIIYVRLGKSYSLYFLFYGFFFPLVFQSRGYLEPFYAEHLLKNWSFSLAEKGHNLERDDKKYKQYGLYISPNT